MNSEMQKKYALGTLRKANRQLWIQTQIVKVY